MYNFLVTLAIFGFLAGIAGVRAFARQANSKGKLLAILGSLLALASACLGAFAWYFLASGM